MLRSEFKVKLESYTKEYYDSISKGYFSAEKFNKLKIIADLGGNFEGVKVLDVGCGTGFISRFVADLGGNVYSMDFSSIALNEARHYHRKKLTLIRADAIHLPFRSSIFDVVLANDIIEHLDNEVRFLQEIYRVLVPGGRLILNTDNAWFQYLQGWYTKLKWMLSKLISFKFKEFYWAARTRPRFFELDRTSRHVKIYSSLELKRLIEYAGFKPLEVKTFFFGESNRLLPSVLSREGFISGCLFRYLRYSTIVMAEK